MGIVEQLTALVAMLNELQAKLSDAQMALEVATKEAYDKGFADGVASVPPVVSDKIFSQAEVDQMIMDAMLPLQKKVEELEVLVAGTDQKIAEALMVFKADLLLKVKEVDAIEDSAMEELLK